MLKRVNREPSTLHALLPPEVNYGNSAEWSQPQFTGEDTENGLERQISGWKDFGLGIR